MYCVAKARAEMLRNKAKVTARNARNIPCRYLSKVSERVGIVWRICGLRKSPKALPYKMMTKFHVENLAENTAKTRKYMQKEDNS